MKQINEVFVYCGPRKFDKNILLIICLWLIFKLLTVMYIPASRNKTSTLHKRQSSSHKNHHNIDPSLTEKLKLKCEALSLELNRLKLIQYELIGWVKQLSLFAPRQIEKHLLKIIHNNNVQSNLSKDRSSPNILIHSKQRLKT